MDSNTFLEKFKEQFIDAEEITVDMGTNFRDLPTWDSLTGMSVLVMIKDEYGVDMTDVDIKACNTVNDIFQFVKVKTEA